MAKQKISTDNPLQKIMEAYMEGIDGHQEYTRYIALAFMLKDLQALAANHEIDFDDVERKALDLDQVEKWHFTVSVERLGET